MLFVIFLDYFYQKKVLVKDLTIRVLIKRVDELTRRLEKFDKVNKILYQEDTVLKAENEVLKAEVAELKQG